MNFQQYQSKVAGFGFAFLCLHTSSGFRSEIFRHGSYKKVKDELAKTIRNFMGGQLTAIPPASPTPLPVEALRSLKKVDILADAETLASQAEAVKQEIIAVGEIFRSLYQGVEFKRSAVEELAGVPKKPDVLWSVLKMTDYIRHANGMIAIPFDYWEDCVEVCIRSRIYNKSNETIAKEYTFKTSKSGVQRAKLSLVARMLAEANLLTDMVLNNGFPPKNLHGTKQPSIKTRGDKSLPEKIS